jgi:hypothetical protein
MCRRTAPTIMAQSWPPERGLRTRRPIPVTIRGPKLGTGRDPASDRRSAPPDKANPARHRERPRAVGAHVAESHHAPAIDRARVPCRRGTIGKRGGAGSGQDQRANAARGGLAGAPEPAGGPENAFSRLASGALGSGTWRVSLSVHMRLLDTHWTLAASVHLTD